MSELPILGVLLGNSAGVGPELVAKLAVSNYYADYCRPVIIGDLRMFEHGLKVVGGDVPHYVISDLSECDWERGYPVLDLKDQDPEQVVYGEANAYCGASDLQQLDTAIELCKAGKIEGFVFGPFHKGAMKMAGLHDESEHTYLAHAFNLTTPFCEVNMMDDLMTVRTTSHIPISDVSANITEENLREAIELGEITGESFGHKPRIAVAALNPHCGEFGQAHHREGGEGDGLERQRSLLRRHAVHQRTGRRLRRGGDHVPRSGPDRPEAGGLPALHHCGGRPALSHRHLRSRHGLRQGGQGHRYHGLL